VRSSVPGCCCTHFVQPLYSLSSANGSSRSWLLELTAIWHIGSSLRKQREFRNWRKGKIPLSFGQARDGRRVATAALGAHLRAAVNDSFFDQKSSSDDGGLLRMISSGVPNFSYACPSRWFCSPVASTVCLTFNKVAFEPFQRREARKVEGDRAALEFLHPARDAIVWNATRTLCKSVAPS
jgi:hypothetical protein